MSNLTSTLLFSLTGAAALTSMSSCKANKEVEPVKKMNIIYIMSDDHSYQTISAYDQRYILNLAGIEKPEEMHGESFLPLLKGEKAPEWRKSLYYHFYEYTPEHNVCRHFGVRTDRYKLIHFYYDIDSWELFDLVEDPTEMYNIYGKPDTEEITKELKAELNRLQEYYDDPIRKKFVIE